jgi:CubicO group peptidase (beta-lactamase class C family)
MTMKTNPILPLSTLCLAAGLALAPGRLGAGAVEQMAAAIERDLNNRCTGYGYAIYQNGGYLHGGGGGSAKFGDPDNIYDPGIPFDEDTVKDCHSMSKTITAAAMLKALEIAKVSLDAPMWTFLPADLASTIPQNSPIRTITFRRLLQHRSGFGASTSYSWAQLKQQLQGGLANPIGTYQYSNWNFAVCRLLLPYLINGQFFRNLELTLAAEPDNGVSQLDSNTSSTYITFVRNQVFAPAGLGTIHPRPVADTLGNFAWYYNFPDPTVPATLMADRRLTVGSGGWAISAKDYARFIAALFQGNILTGDQLQEMLDSELGVFDRTGANGSDLYYTHNGATTDDLVGGRSVWMRFPNGISAAVQVNSIQNGYSAAGLGLDLIVQEAWENAYGSKKPATLEYPVHLMVHRAQDGWLLSRGVNGSGNLGARNFDYDYFHDEAPAGFTHHLSLAVGNQAFLLRYKGDTGRAIMHPLNQNGTLGNEVFDSEGWLSGWTHLESFQTFAGTFLLLHNSSSGRIRTVPVYNSGNLGPHVTDATYSSGFDIAEILRLGGVPHLFRHNTSTGETHLRVLDSDGAVGATAYSATWSTGFTQFEFYQAGGNPFLFRYHPSTGAARINRIDGSLANTPQVLDAVWSPGWRQVRFFEIGSQAWFFRYNPETGDARMQQIDSDGTPGAQQWSSGDWLRATVGTGPFDPSTTGWDEVLIYDATPGAFQLPQDLAGYDDIPAEIGVAIQPLPAVPANLQTLTLNLQQPAIHNLRGTPAMQWQSQRGARYYVERSLDLRNWEIVGTIDGDDNMLQFDLLPDPAGGPAAPSAFFRMIAFEIVPPLPASRLPGR